MCKRFWIEFNIDSVFLFPPGIGTGCGVTAFDLEDAIKLMNEKIFILTPVPEIIKAIEDININELDQGHVIPNMLSPHSRGIWFPRGYQY
jgi:hypothetical protein